MQEFRGRVAVVTGGASGVGKALAKAFLGEGMKVVIADVEESALRATTTELGQNATLNIIDFGLFDGCHIEFIDELAGYWKFDESTGATAADAGPSNRSGTLVNMEESDWVAGQINNALSFDGVDDHVVITGYKGVTGTKSRTVSAWIKTTDTDWSDIISWGNAGLGERWLLTVNPAGVVLQVAVFGGYSRGSTSVSDGQWHHVAAVLESDGSPDTSDIRLYVDGVEEVASVLLRTINTPAIEDVRIGIFIDAGLRYFKGMIDDVRIYNRALSDSEIMNLAN